MSNSLISADNTWALWAVIVCWTAISIYLEQRYKWASKLSGAILALLGPLVLSNLGIIPTASPVYDAIWDYIVPLSIPLMLFNSNLKKIWKSSGKMVFIFLISSVGTMLGAIAAHAAIGGITPETGAVAATMTGSYTGGTQNFAAMATMSGLSGGMTSALVVADNLLMGILFAFMIAMPNMKFFRNHFPHPYVDELALGSDSTAETNEASAYWAPKEISLKNIAMALATSFAIVAVSNALCGLFKNIIVPTNAFTEILYTVLGNQYLVLTTITVIIASLQPDYCESLHGAQEIGFFFIYLFLTVIGAPASIPLILKEAPILLLYCAIICVINLAVSLVFGKIFKFSIEEIIVASNANIGGAATAMAFTISKGWKRLIVPSMLVGVLGYIVGNYCGTIVWLFLK